MDNWENVLKAVLLQLKLKCAHRIKLTGNTGFSMSQIASASPITTSNTVRTPADLAAVNSSATFSPDKAALRPNPPTYTTFACVSTSALSSLPVRTRFAPRT